MTDRPINKRNPAPKAFPRLAWERDRRRAGVKSAILVLGEGRFAVLTVSRESVNILGVVRAHNGGIDDIRTAARRVGDRLRFEGLGAAILKALADAEGEG
jgi:hypothetical protein